MRLDPNSAGSNSDPFEFCKQEQIIGVGHQLYRDETYDTLDEVIEGHRRFETEKYSEEKRTRFTQNGDLAITLRSILKEMSVGDYVWVKKDNTFALCRVRGDWEISSNMTDREYEQYHANDIHNFRPVEWKDIPYPMVPGFVRRAFSGPFGTITRMRSPINDTTREIIERLFDAEDLKTTTIVDREVVATKIRKTSTDEFFNRLGPSETEDVVLNYLQSQGWKVMKSSTSQSQAEIECELRRGSERGYIQVKSGGSGAKIELDDYKEYTDLGKMLFFSMADIPLQNHKNMIQINPVDVKDYVENHVLEMPEETLLRFEFENET